MNQITFKTCSTNVNTLVNTSHAIKFSTVFRKSLKNKTNCTSMLYTPFHATLYKPMKTLEQSLSVFAY